MNGSGTSPIWRGGHLEKWLGHNSRKPRRVGADNRIRPAVVSNPAGHSDRSKRLGLLVTC
jgi:hypothetical protein